MVQSMPTRDVVIERIERLCSGQDTRAEVATWAMSIVDDDSLSVTDQLVWAALKRLGAVDLPAPDREFLYSVADFKEWQSELL